jgi:TPR repeat protein
MQDVLLSEGVSAYDNSNYERAFELLMPLAQQGVCKAQCHIACMYQLGLGVSESGKQAKDWYLKAGEQNVLDEVLSGTAYHNLSVIYTVGSSDLKSDLQKSEEYKKLSVALGFDM